jgi:hypothetical protein
MFKRHCVVKYVDSLGVEHAGKVEVVCTDWTRVSGRADSLTPSLLELITIQPPKNRVLRACVIYQVVCDTNTRTEAPRMAEHSQEDASRARKIVQRCLDREAESLELEQDLAVSDVESDRYAFLSEQINSVAYCCRTSRWRA